jgi:hypothetical protein
MNESSLSLFKKRLSSITLRRTSSLSKPDLQVCREFSTGTRSNAVVDSLKHLLIVFAISNPETRNVFCRRKSLCSEGRLNKMKTSLLA